MNRKLMFLMVLLIFGLPLALFGCNDSGGGSSADTSPFGPPSEPVGQYTINTSGGDSTNSAGGAGSDIDLYLDYGSGGDIKMFNTGQADASFTFPSNISTYLGLNPLQITNDTTISVVAAEPSNGTPYFVENDIHIYISDGNGTPADETYVTGLSVSSGATLTLALNYNSATRTEIYLENDLYNAGTMTTNFQGATLDRGNLRISCDNFHGDAGSSIVLTGQANDSGVGGNGGYCFIDTDDDEYNFEEDIGSIYNQGAIDTSGGDGSTAGGNAGQVDLYAETHLMNTANISAFGGEGASGAGGNGADIELDTYLGQNYNSGNLNASGGSGTAGGNAGAISLFLGDTGDLLNSGNLTANGGNGSNTTGGQGGDIGLDADAAKVVNTGTISAYGGTGAAGTGGAGGNLTVYADYEYGWYGGYTPPGNIELSGNINLAGGDSTDGAGGQGGYIVVELDADYVPANQELILYGYTGIDTSGGNGATTGGNAGDIYCYNEYAYDGNYLPGGGIANYIDITANGGNGGTASGGSGGNFRIYTEDEYGYDMENELAHNYADLNLRGGDGNNGGTGGEVYIFGFNGALNEGDIDASGGSGAASGGDAANEAGVVIVSDTGPAENTGNIDSSGGDSTGSSGYGGYASPIEIVGYTSAGNSGQLSVAGGDADPTSGTGGDADAILLYGIYEGTTNSATAPGGFDISGGSAGTPGASGEVIIDGQNVTDNWL